MPDVFFRTLASRIHRNMHPSGPSPAQNRPGKLGILLISQADFNPLPGHGHSEAEWRAHAQGRCRYAALNCHLLQQSRIQGLPDNGVRGIASTMVSSLRPVALHVLHMCRQGDTGAAGPLSTLAVYICFPLQDPQDRHCPHLRDTGDGPVACLPQHSSVLQISVPLLLREIHSG